MGEMIKVAAKKSEAKRENKPLQTQKTGSFQSISSPIDQILFLQRTIGNQAVGRLIKSGALQAKLRIGQPGDIYEQEADRVAERVMTMPEPGEQKKPIEEEKLHRQPILEREEELQMKTTSSSIPEVQPYIESHIQSLKGAGHPLSKNDRAFFEPRFGHDFSQMRVNTHAHVADTAQLLNTKTFTSGREVAKEKSNQEYGELKIDQFKREDKDVSSNSISNLQKQEKIIPDNSSVSRENANLESMLGSSKGHGRPLEDNTKRTMENHFGADFSPVRVHTDQRAVQMSHDLNAHAFTHGRDIYFNQGSFSSDSVSGQRLLAHELTHTLQQGATHLVQKTTYDEDDGVAQTKSELKNVSHIQRRVDEEKNKNRIKQLIKNKDISGIKDLDVDTLKMATIQQQAEMIFIVLDQKWVGPLDEFAIFRIFSSTTHHYALLTLIAQKENGMEKLVSKIDNEVFKSIFVAPYASIFQKRFKEAAVARAKVYLNENKKYLEGLKEKYSFSESQCSLDDIPVRDRIEELKAMAQSYLAIGDGAAKLSRQISDILRPYAIQQALIGSIIPTKIPTTLGTVWTDIPVDLKKVPVRIREQVWKLDQKRKTLYKAQLELETNYPTLIPLIEDRELTKFSKMESAYEASKLVIAKLDGVIAKIEETKKKLSGGEDADLDILDVPKALDLVKKENSEFQKPFPKWAVDDLIKSHQLKEMVRNIAIGIGSGAAFIAAEYATAGQATWFFLGLGIGLGATGAAMNIEEALDLITASETDIRKDRKLVAEEAAQSALLWAMVDVILTGLDIIQVGKGLKLLKARSTRVLHEAGEQALKETGEDVASKALKKASRQGEDYQKAAKNIEGELEKIAHAADKAAEAKEGFAEAWEELTKALGKKYSVIPGLPSGPLLDPEVYKALVNLAKQAIRANIYDLKKFIGELKLAMLKAGRGNLTPKEIAKIEQAWREARILEAADATRYLRDFLTKYPDILKGLAKKDLMSIRKSIKTLLNQGIVTDEMLEMIIRNARKLKSHSVSNVLGLMTKARNVENAIEVFRDIARGPNWDEGAMWMLEWIDKRKLWGSLKEFEEVGFGREWDALIGRQVFQFKSWTAFYPEKFLPEFIKDVSQKSGSDIVWVFHKRIGNVSQVRASMRDAIGAAENLTKGEKTKLRKALRKVTIYVGI